MTNAQALKLLSDATQPGNIGRLTRGDFVNIEIALGVFAELVKRAEQAQPDVPPRNGRDLWAERPEDTPAPTRASEP